MGTRKATSTINIKIDSEIENILDIGKGPSHRHGGNLVTEILETGAEANQANRAWRYQPTITSGNSVDIDLFDAGTIDIGAGAGLDALGQQWDCEEIVCLVIRQKSGAGRLEVNATTPSNNVPWIPTMTVANNGALRAGGMVIFYMADTDAFDITDASEHTVRIGANGGDIVADIFVIGRNDDEVSSSSSSTSSSTSSASSASSSRSTSSSSSTSSISSSSTSTVSSVSSSTLSSSST